MQVEVQATMQCHPFECSRIETVSETLQSSRGTVLLESVQPNGLEHAESPFADWKPTTKAIFYVEMVVDTE